MSINDREVLRLEPDQSVWDVYMQSDGVCGYGSDPSAYLNEDCSELRVGSVLLVPTYRLEEVEEIIEPEKPGVPVEPYVGLVWRNIRGDRRIVASVDGGKCEVLAEDGSHPLSWDRCVSPVSDLTWSNYPHTPSTPAVTRKVKKWVKIEHPEVPE